MKPAKTIVCTVACCLLVGVIVILPQAKTIGAIEALYDPPNWVLALIVTSSILLYKNQISSNRSSYFLGLTLAFALSMLLVSLPNINPNRHSYLIGIIIYTSFGLTSAALSPSLRITIILLCLVGGLESIFAFSCYLTHTSGVYSGSIFRPNGSTGSAVDLPVILACCLSLGILRDQNSNPIWITAATLVTFMGLIVSGSRNGWIGLSCACTTGVLFARSQHIRLLLFALITLGCFWACSSLRAQGERNFTSTLRSNESRFYLWSASYEWIEKHPLIGGGIGNIGLDIPVERAQGVAVETIVDPKNQFIYMLIESGIVGCALLLITMISPIILCWSSPDVGLKSLGLSLATYFFLGLFDTPILAYGRFSTTGLFALLVGTALRFSGDYVGPKIDKHHAEQLSKGSLGSSRETAKCSHFLANLLGL